MAVAQAARTPERGATIGSLWLELGQCSPNFDGAVSADELRAALTELEPALTAAQCHELAGLAHAEGDGAVVDQDEVRHFLSVADASRDGAATSQELFRLLNVTCTSGLGSMLRHVLYHLQKLVVDPCLTRKGVSPMADKGRFLYKAMTSALLAAASGASPHQAVTTVLMRDGVGVLARDPRALDLARSTGRLAEALASKFADAVFGDPGAGLGPREAHEAREDQPSSPCLCQKWSGLLGLKGLAACPVCSKALLVPRAPAKDGGAALLVAKVALEPAAPSLPIVACASATAGGARRRQGRWGFRLLACARRSQAGPAPVGKAACICHARPDLLLARGQFVCPGCGRSPGLWRPPCLARARCDSGGSSSSGGDVSPDDADAECICRRMRGMLVARGHAACPNCKRSLA